MKTITILTDKSYDHQNSFGTMLAAGLARHGYTATQRPYTEAAKADTKLTACWGWRVGQALRQREHEVLVMERGYLGDRMRWTSLTYNGLNGLGTWPELRVTLTQEQREARFYDRFGKALKPMRTMKDGKYILVIGQVPNDMSLAGKDLRGWQRRRSDELWLEYQIPIVLRPHPLDQRRLEDQAAGLVSIESVNIGSLSAALSNAAGVVCWNSNTAVDAVLAGLPTEVSDAGSLMYGCTQRRLGHDEQTDAARITALTQLAWRQWLPEEIKAGLPWDMFGTPHDVLGDKL